MSATVHNPFRDLRNRQGISQYELARRAGITKHAVLRLEQGCYQEPLPSLVDYFLREFPKITKTYLLEEYRSFQYHTRQRNALLLGTSLPLILDDLPVGIHPLVYLRSAVGINPTELAKRLCITQSTVVYFEQRSISQKTVPHMLIEALHDADYDEQDTDALVAAYEKYRTWLKAEKKLTLVKNEAVSV